MSLGQYVIKLICIRPFLFVYHRTAISESLKNSFNRCYMTACSTANISMKDDGKPRLSVDYRRINKITISEPTTMPVITDTIRDRGETTMFFA